jgi:hypothetical protein
MFPLLPGFLFAYRLASSKSIASFCTARGRGLDLSFLVGGPRGRLRANG